MTKLGSKKKRTGDFSASQALLPGHLAGWPDLKIKVPLNPQPPSKPKKQIFCGTDDDKKTIKPSTQTASIRNDTDDTSCSTSSSGGGSEAGKSLTDIVDEVYDKTQESSKPKTAVDDGVRNDISSSESSSEDDSSDIDVHRLVRVTKESVSPSPTTVRVNSSSKKKLKSAIASRKVKYHDRNKFSRQCAPDNVLNARSPVNSTSLSNTPARRESTPTKSATSSKTSKIVKLKGEVKPKEALSVVTQPTLRAERSNEPPPSSLTTKPDRMQSSEHEKAFETPIPGNQGSETLAGGPYSTGLPKAGQFNGPSHAPTLIKEQCDSTGHRVFSSSAFTRESSSEHVPEKHKEKETKVKGTRENAVLAEARRQALRLQEHERKKTKARKKAKKGEKTPANECAPGNPVESVPSAAKKAKKKRTRDAADHDEENQKAEQSSKKSRRSKPVRLNSTSIDEAMNRKTENTLNTAVSAKHGSNSGGFLHPAQRLQLKIQNTMQKPLPTTKKDISPLRYKYDDKALSLTSKIRAIVPQAMLHAACARLNAELRYHRQIDARLKETQTSENKRMKEGSCDENSSDDLSSEHDEEYKCDNPAVTLAAVHDLLIVFSGKLLGLNLTGDAAGSKGRTAVGSLEVSAMEAELMRIAGERAKENEILREQVRNLEAMVQQLRK